MAEGTIFEVALLAPLKPDDKAQDDLIRGLEPPSSAAPKLLLLESAFAVCSR